MAVLHRYCASLQCHVCDITVCGAVLRVGSGHYTAYGCHEGRWYHFNDSTVTVSSEDTVRKAKAYILFYVERPAKVASTNTAPADAVAVDAELAAAVQVAANVGEVKKEDIVSAVGLAPDLVTLPLETDKAAVDETVGGQSATADWEEERFDGDLPGKATSDAGATDSDSQALASNAAQ